MIIIILMIINNSRQKILLFLSLFFQLRHEFYIMNYGCPGFNRKRGFKSFSSNCKSVKLQTAVLFARDNRKVTLAIKIFIMTEKRVLSRIIIRVIYKSSDQHATRRQV